jgi:hypothetical protein
MFHNRHEQDQQDIRVCGPGSPIAAALATGDGSAWQVGEYADGSPIYFHPGTVAGPGVLLRNRYRPTPGGKTSLIRRLLHSRPQS